MKKHFLALLLSLSLLPMLFPTFVYADGSTPPAIQAYIGTPGTTSITTELGSTVTLTAVVGPTVSPTAPVQWYESDSDLNNGTKIESATIHTCTVPTDATGTYYYYCTCNGGDYKSNVLTVTVKGPSYMIGADSNPGNEGTVTGAGSYTDGDTCTLTATPATGCYFVNWTEDGGPVSTSQSYKFTVDRNRNLTANFVNAFSVGDNFRVDNIKYSITSLSPAQVAVTGADVDSLTIPSTVHYKDVDYTVKSINKSAFHDSTLNSITIPESVTSIGEHAFDSCQGLTSVTIPNSVKSIGKSAFSGCTSLTSITIPASVTEIEDSAFSSCTGLQIITIPNSETSIAKNAFTNDKTNLVFVSDSPSIPSSWNFWLPTYQYHKTGTYSGTVSTVGNISTATVVSPNGGLSGVTTSIVAVPPATVDSIRTAAGIPASYATVAAGDLKIGNGEFNGPLTITLLLNSSLDQYDMANARVLHDHGGALEVLTPELSPARIVDGAMLNYLSFGTRSGASPFVIVAPLKNSQAVSQQNSQPATAVAAENPKTGDTSFLFIWGMLSIALYGAIVIIKRIRA